MFRRADSRSLLFQCFSWLFLAALFCDSANIDDLCRGVIVLHDDCDILSLPASFRSTEYLHIKIRHLLI